MFTQSLGVLIKPHALFSPHIMSALNSTVPDFVAGEDNRLATGTFGVAAILKTTILYYALQFRHDRPYGHLPVATHTHFMNSFTQANHITHFENVYLEEV
jgi:hypothetical protein